MKRIISLLLTAVLLGTLLSVFVLPASAEGEEEKKPENAKWFEDNGDNLVWWELTDNGAVLPDGKTGLTLTVGGKGYMPVFNAAIAALDKRPWKGCIETITTVVIESGVTNIGTNAFYGCTNLTSVTIPSSVTDISDGAFQNCTSLQSVTIPSSVETIESSAFCGCKSLQSVTIPYGVEFICSNAFENCASLQSVTIPYGVTIIDGCAFKNCTSLQSVTIPSSVTDIDNNAFQGCANLTSVTIPSSVKKIDGNVFGNCNQLASVTVKASTPPTLGSRVFNMTPGNLAIYVPCGAGTAYQEAWSGYRDQIKEAYIVDDQPVGKGTIMLDKDCFPTGNFAEEQTVTVTVVPAEGYQFKEDGLTVSYKDGEEEIPVELTQDETDPTKYYFTMLPANVTVKAAFSCVQHTEGDWEVETKATCTTDGKEVQKCKYCGEVIAEKFIPAGHTAGEWEITPATCGEDGKKVKKCEICGEVLASEVIPAPGHPFDTTKWCYDSVCHWYAPTCEHTTARDTHYAAHTYIPFIGVTCTICGYNKVTGSGSGSILSGGNLWIIIGGAVIAVGAVVAAVVVVKKKKRKGAISE